MQTRGDEFKPHGDGYLYTIDREKKPADVTKHPLPSIMYYIAKSEMSGKTSEAYIEYAIHATAGGKIATYPIFIRRKSTDLPITDPHMKYRSFLQTIQTPRLLVEHADKKLTFRQKSSRFFRPGKTPKYVYQVKVETPSIIQLEHPDPIPFNISIIPDMHPTRTTLAIADLPPVYLTQFKLQLELIVDIRCPGNWWDSDNDKHHHIDIPIRFPQRTTIPTMPPAATDRPLTSSFGLQSVSSTTPERNLNFYEPIPSTTQSDPILALSTAPVPSLASTNHNHDPLPRSATPLNIGSLLSLSLTPTTLHTPSPPIRFKRPLYPTFTTYNIKLHYALKYTISLSCAGEYNDLSGVAPVTILAPSEEQEREKLREMGKEGMKRNYDDLMAGLEAGWGLVEGILGAI